VGTSIPRSNSIIGGKRVAHPSIFGFGFFAFSLLCAASISRKEAGI
jgi:hypothetical protein